MDESTKKILKGAEVLAAGIAGIYLFKKKKPEIMAGVDKAKALAKDAVKTVTEFLKEEGTKTDKEDA